MSDNRITINDVHKHTNGGLDVILSLFPDAFGSIAQPNKKFKMRGEKTASAKLNQLKDGTYRVVDFGNSEESLNCVELYMEEMGTTFGRAIQAIAQQYNVKPEVQEVIKSKFSSRPANPEEKEGDQTFEIRDSWTDAEIEYIVSRNVLKEIGWNSKVKGEKEEAYARIAGVFKEYNWYPLISFSTVKDRVVKTSSSTPDYPIFLWDEGQLKKIYQPKNHKKEFRFMYGTGSKVGDFIHGLKQLQEAYIKRTNGNTATINENAENADLRIGVEAKKTEKPEFDQVLLMSGGSDAINAAILGYRVIWGTSETFVLKGWQFGEIMKTTDKLCQLMDLDATGKDVAHKRNMEYINLHTIELPVSLLERQDSRGYQCKDFRDYMNYYSAWEFSLLVKTSMPYRFWDEKMKYDRQERPKGIDYDFNNAHAYNFLHKNGFFRIPVGTSEDDFQYIQIVGSTVKRTNPVRIKSFINKFIEDRNEPIALRNAIYNTTRLSDSSLTNLNETELDFEDFTPFSQLLFFRNIIIEVTAKGLREVRTKDADRYVWEKEIYDHHFKTLDKPPFEITKDSTGAYDIVIHNYDCMFFRYLIQTSRIHWRTELEERLDASDKTPAQKDEYRKIFEFRIDGELLTPDEIEEQKSHLINKIFAMGYLMHRYKNYSKAWLVVGMDAKKNLDGKAQGGSGKSILYNLAMCELLKTNHMLNGKNTNLDKDSHIMDGVTEHHRYVYIDDAHQYLDLEFLYPSITGNLPVNPKGKQPFVIPFKRAPKFSMTTNWGIRNNSPSTARRILYTATSDYYHNKGEGSDYREHRDPGTEFGKQFFIEFNEHEYNQFYNTAAFALSFYLGTSTKVEPQMDSVNDRNLRDAIGTNMMDWCEVYFDDEGDNVNKFIVREEAFKDFMYHNPRTKETANSWRNKVKSYCQLNGYEFNPKEYLGKRNNIIKKTAAKVYEPRLNIWTTLPGEPLVPKEHFYIRTPLIEVPDNVQPPEYRQADIDFVNEKDKPLNF